MRTNLPRSPSAVTRRTALAALGAGGLGLALAAHGFAAFAPGATPAGTPFPMAGHPIIGVWRFDLELRQPGTDLATFVFAEQGTFIAASVALGWIGFGTWRATGARAAELASFLQDIRPQDVFAPNFVPVENVFEPGMLFQRVFLEVDGTGNVVKGVSSGTIYQPDGTVGHTFDDERSMGTRMEVIPTTGAATPTS